MATRLFYHAALSGLSNLPTTNQSALTPATPIDYPSDAFTVNRVMDRDQGVATSQYRTIGTDSSATLKSYYLTRFVTEGLQAQTISANTWTYNFCARHNTSNLNFPCTGSNQVVYVCVYVWRPGTGKVFTIYEGNSSANANEPASAGTGYSQIVTFSGTSGSVQANDVICQEIWFRIDPAAYIAQNQGVWIYDGQRTVITTNNTSIAASLDYAAFLETPQDILFASDPVPVIDATSDHKDVLQQSPQQLITNSI